MIHQGLDMIQTKSGHRWKKYSADGLYLRQSVQHFRHLGSCELNNCAYCLNCGWHSEPSQACQHNRLYSQPIKLVHAHLWQKDGITFPQSMHSSQAVQDITKVRWEITHAFSSHGYQDSVGQSSVRQTHNWANKTAKWVRCSVNYYFTIHLDVLNVAASDCGRSAELLSYTVALWTAMHNKNQKLVPFWSSFS